MEARDRTIEKWIHAIENGQLQLPRFQRFEAWGPGQVADLVKTVIDGLPAGAVLVLKVAGPPPFKARPLETAPEGPDSITELLLDAASLNNLASLFQAQGELAEARPLYERALEISERVLGPDHPRTVATRGSLQALLDLLAPRPTAAHQD